MPKKIDDLLSPERLRTHWEKQVKEPVPAAVRDENADTPPEIFKHLRELSQRRFAGEDTAALNILLDELDAHLKRLFPQAGGSEVPADTPADVIPAAYDILNRIEDLAEAFEMAARNKRSP